MDLALRAEELCDAGGGVEGGIRAGRVEDGGEALVEMGVVLEREGGGAEAGEGHPGDEIELAAAGGNAGAGAMRSRAM